MRNADQRIVSLSPLQLRLSTNEIFGSLLIPMINIHASNFNAFPKWCVKVPNKVNGAKTVAT